MVASRHFIIPADRQAAHRDGPCPSSWDADARSHRLAAIVAVASLIDLALVALDEMCTTIAQWYIRSDSRVKLLILCLVDDVLVKLLVFGFLKSVASRSMQELGVTMHDNQELEPYAQPSPAGGFLQLILGVIFLLLVIVGLIAGWGTFLKAAPVLVQILVILVAFAAPGAVIAKGAKSVYLDFQQIRAVTIRVHMDEERLQAMQDARWRENSRAEAEAEKLRAEAERIRAEAEKVRIVIPFDDQGNAALRDPATWHIIQLQGNMRAYPALSSLHYRYDYKDTSTRASEQKPGMLPLGSTPLALPKAERFYETIPFNSLQVGLGAELETGRLVLAPIVHSTHFKFIGSSGSGKSCVAAALLDIATTTNDPDRLRIGLLDLEHNTSRLFEDVPHIAEIGPRRVRLVGCNPDEVAQRLKLLQWELKRRSDLGEEHCRAHEPILLVYIEEMLALKYEVVDEQLKKEMLAAINILGVRARKYGIFLLACMQIDYSDKSTREAMAQFRTRGGFAIDPEAARASGFFNTELVKQNFQTGRPGQYVLEKPAYSGIVLAPDYDVSSKLAMLGGATTRTTTGATMHEPRSHDGQAQLSPYRVGSGTVEAARPSPTTSALEADAAPLSAQEWRIIEKWRSGMGLKAIIASEYTNSKGEPLAGGDLFTQKAKEIQMLIARFLPAKRPEGT